MSYESEHLVVDCGPGATYKMVRSGLSPTDVSALLLTHHHFDHTPDAAALMLTRWESSVGHERALSVVGPVATRPFVDALVGPQGAYRPDITARREAPLSQAKYQQHGGVLPRPDLDVDVTELEPGGGVALGRWWKISTTAGRHVQPHHKSLAYRVDLPGRSMAVTGDTEFHPGLVDIAAGADVLVAMCVDTEERYQAKGPLRSGQMATGAVNRLAVEADVSTVVLTHTGLHLAEPRQRGAGAAGGRRRVSR